MEEKTEILNNHKGEMVYIEYMNGKVPAEIIGVISNEFKNAYVKIWHTKDGRLNPIFIPIFGIGLIANYDYVWGRNKEQIYYNSLDKEVQKILK